MKWIFHHKVQDISEQSRWKNRKCTNFIERKQKTESDKMIILNNPDAKESVQLLSRVQLSATLWTAACQASLSITNCWSLPKHRSTELVMPSNHLILCHPLLLLPLISPSIRAFSNESALRWLQSTGVSASTSVLPINTQNWSPKNGQQ